MDVLAIKETLKSSAVRVWEKLHHFRSDSPFTPWLLAVTVINPSKNARFTVGNGSGAEISVETFSGTIEIRQK